MGRRRTQRIQMIVCKRLSFDIVSDRWGLRTGPTSDPYKCTTPGRNFFLVEHKGSIALRFGFSGPSLGARGFFRNTFFEMVVRTQYKCVTQV